MQERVKLDIFTSIAPRVNHCWRECYKSPRISARGLPQVVFVCLGLFVMMSIRCGQPCLQAAENTLLPCITAAVGEAMICEFEIGDFLQS